MATTKIWKIESRLDHVIDYATDKNKTKNLRYKNENEVSFSVRSALKYATNPEKTEKQYFVSGVNCEPENALKQMMETKKKFKKDKYSKNNKIAAFHAYQSFCEGEVSPKKAHEIGIKLAEEIWGDRFEVVVSTNLNTRCIHNHFVVNSVSFVDGKKYYSNLENTAILRQTSDDICDEFGLNVLRKGDYKIKKVDFNYYFKKSIKNSDMYIFAKEDIDFAIKQARTYKDFEKIMRTLGYYIYKRGSGISVRKDTMKRNMRITRAFGREYSFERINNRIWGNMPQKFEEPGPITLKKNFKMKGKIQNKKKVTGIRALYLYYCYLLRVYPKKKVQSRLTPELRAAIRKMETYSKEIRFMGKNNINTLEDLDVKKSELEGKLKLLLNERDRLYYKRKVAKYEESKENIGFEIQGISGKIKVVRDEIWMCKDIRTNSEKVEKDLKEFEVVKNERKRQIEMEEKVKKKERMYER